MLKNHRTALTGADESALAGTGRFVTLCGLDQVHRRAGEPVQQRDSDNVDPVHDAKPGVPPCIDVLPEGPAGPVRGGAGPPPPGSAADHPAEPFGHRGGSAGKPPAHSLNRSIRPGVPVPATVLIAEMSGGSLLLQGWRNGPSAYVSADDAAPLRRALAAAYGSEYGDEALS